MTSSLNLEEQLVAQAIKTAMSNWLQDSEFLDVEISTDLGKIIQGKADSVAISGQGLVVEDNIRLQNLSVQTNRIEIDSLSALLGDVKLDQPLDTLVRVVFTEKDLNRALNSRSVQQKIQPLSLQVEEQMVQVELLFPAEVKLLGDDLLGFSSGLLIQEARQARNVHFSAVLVPPVGEEPLYLQQFKVDSGKGLKFEFVVSLIKYFYDLLKQPYLQLEEMSLKLQSLRVVKGALEVVLEIHLYQIPKM